MSKQATPTPTAPPELTTRELELVAVMRETPIIGDMVLLLVQHIGFQQLVKDLGLLLYEGRERRMHSEVHIDFEPQKQMAVRLILNAAPVRRRKDDPKEGPTEAE